MYKTYKFRLKLSKSAHVALDKALKMQAELYNSALQERIESYRKTGKSSTLFDQMKSLTQIRKDDPDWEALSVQIGRGTLTRLNKAYQSFFNRGGFPRFKSSLKWRTLEVAAITRTTYSQGKICIKGLPPMKVIVTRKLPEGQPVSVKITKSATRTTVAMTYKLPDVSTIKAPVNPVGLDMGINTFAYASDGTSYTMPVLDRRELKRKQRAVSRKVKGSNSRRKAVASLKKCWEYITDSRNQVLHRLSSAIVNKYDGIVVEDLQIKNMVKNHHLSRSISEQGWGKFLKQIEYKAEWAGIPFAQVNPYNTSQNCSQCGTRVKKSLGVRIHKCEDCGLVLNRDHNAALNILSLGIAEWVGEHMPVDSIEWNTNKGGNLMPPAVKTVDEDIHNVHRFAS